MLGLGLQATLRPKAEGAARPVQDGLVLADNFRKSPVNDELGLTFPSNGSAEFNGTSDYIQLPDPFSNTNHTIAAWVYANDTAANKFVFDNRDALNDGVLLRASSTETIEYYINNGSGAATTSTFADEWVFITATYDGTTAKIYANGSLEGSESISATISVTSDALIGISNTAVGNYFNGNLANVAVWNRALTSDEINSVMWKGYDSLTASEQNGLQAWYALDDITGTDVPDSTGNYNGTAY
jgi:hypothetical protein